MHQIEVINIRTACSGIEHENKSMSTEILTKATRPIVETGPGLLRSFNWMLLFVVYNNPVLVGLENFLSDAFYF